MKKLRFLKIILVVTVLFMCGQVSMAKTSVKMSNTNLNKTLDLHAMSIKVEEMRLNELYSPLDTYVGEITGYVADCPECSGKLGCNGLDVLTERTLKYNDKDYGDVRIVASSKSLPCGSIVQFDLLSISERKITAIVLDRGVIGTKIDLLVETPEEAIKKIGRRQISYDILRIGYSR